MSVALRTITRLQDADDINVSLGAGVDEYALCWDNDTARFVLRAPAAPFAGILATGATVGATAQAQAFTLGVVSPFLAPAADSTTAWQVRKADKTTAVVTVDTTNGRVGIGTTSPGTSLHVTSGNIIIGQYNFDTGATPFKQVLCGEYTSNALGLSPSIILPAQVNWIGWGQGAATGNVVRMGAVGDINTAWPALGAYSFSFVIDGNVGIGTSAPATRLDIDAGALTMKEMTAPTGVANKAMLYTKDNGSGKTQLCVKLGDDVEIVIATQA